MSNTEVENIIDNIGVSKWQSGLAQTINETYSYANNSLFYAMLPTYYRDYGWRYIRQAVQWLDGYVWSLHSTASGIVSTRVGSKLITGLTKQVVGETLLFKKADKSEGLKANETLRKVAKWSDDNNIFKAVYSAVGFALGVGTSLLKMNKRLDGTIWWEAVRFDRCFYKASFTNEIYDATFIINSYVDTKQGSETTSNYFLVEHRYYHIYNKPEILELKNGGFETLHTQGERVPMVEYKVVRVEGQMFGNVLPSNVNTRTYKWTELPKDIREMIKKDYSAIRFDEPLKLGFNNLGVVALLNGEIDLSVPTGTNFGESMLVGIQDDLITYELASSYLIRDMYAGKGTIYVPKSLNLGDIMGGTGNSAIQGYGDTKYEMVKGVSPEEQKIVVEQFELRGQEWQTIKENSLKNIAVKWGMSPKILSSFLAPTQMTATQIDSEDDMSIAFIYHTRAYFKNAINTLLETTLNFMGLPANIKIEFASPSLINKDRILDRIIKQLENGLIEIDDALRTLYPDLDEESLQMKIKLAKESRERIKQEQQSEMNFDGTFGLDDMLNDDEQENSFNPNEFKGSTEISQHK